MLSAYGSAFASESLISKVEEQVLGMCRNWMWVFVAMSSVASFSTQAMEHEEIFGKWYTIGSRCAGGTMDTKLTPEVLEIAAGFVEYRAKLQYQFPTCGELKSTANESQFRKIDGFWELSELTAWRSDYCTLKNGPVPEVIHHRVSHLEKFARRYRVEKWGEQQVLIEEISDFQLCPSGGRFQMVFEEIP